MFAVTEMFERMQGDSLLRYITYNVYMMVEKFINLNFQEINNNSIISCHPAHSFVAVLPELYYYIERY